MFNFIGLLANIENMPGSIVGPFAAVLGFVINMVFNVVGSLGISIIVLTIIVRIFMIPMGIKMQKSSIAMQKLAPEINKIKEKYGETKDPELVRKKNAEIQAVYSTNKVNMFGSCLPMLLTMPVFFGLSYVFRHSYLYIQSVDVLYEQIAMVLMQMEESVAVLGNIAMARGSGNLSSFHVDLVSDLRRLIGVISPAEWDVIYAGLTDALRFELDALLTQKGNIEVFFGINLLANSGWAFPGILIPILTAVTTFLSTYLMGKANKNADAAAKSQQKIMLIIMPLMLGYMTVNFSAGVGLYWTVSSIFATVQQYFINKHFRKDSDSNIVKVVR